RERGADGARGVGGIAWEPERPRQDARRASRQEPDRKGTVRAVQRLVVRAVAGEDDDRVDRVDRSGGGELRRVPRVLREARLDVDLLTQRVLDRRDRRTGHVGRVWIDDEERP